MRSRLAWSKVPPSRVGPHWVIGTPPISQLIRREVADRVVVMYCGQVVEEAQKVALFERPLHPYTLGLLNSIPRLEDDDAKRLYTIKGTVPSPLDMPRGCPFSDRCDRCMERCRRERPELRPVPGTPGRSVRCFLFEGEE